MLNCQIIQTFAVAFLVATCSSALADDLRPFTPMGSYCTFATVDGRRPVTSDYRRGEGADEAQGKLYCFDQQHCRCQVRYVDLPESKRSLSRRDLVAQYGIASWSERGELKSLGVVKSGKSEGEDFDVVGLRTSSGDSLVVRVRIFVAGKRAYIVSASCTGEKEKVAEPEATAFLASFGVEK